MRHLFGAGRKICERSRAGRQFAGSLLLLTALILTAGRAQALPAFAAQTSQHCTACHVGGFGPQLTPLGREFKIEGYTLRNGTEFTVPVSVMTVASYLHTAKDVAFPPAPGYGANDNLAVDKQSVFLA